MIKSKKLIKKDSSEFLVIHDRLSSYEYIYFGPSFQNPYKMK